jgi:hypothetical protein
MTSDSVDSLEDLASRVDQEFASHRQSDEFKAISLVIDSSSSERPTLIVHADGEQASSLADRVEEFLTEHGANTQREFHSETDIRILATVE